LLKTPEERRRRLEEIPEIHADPNMDPSYDSDDDGSEMDDNKQEMFTRPKGSSYSRKGREPISPGKGDFASKDSWSGTRKNPSKSWELDRNLSSKSLSNKAEDATLSLEALHERLSPASSPGTVSWSSHSAVRADLYSGVASETSLTPLSAPVIEAAAKVNETDKTWHYKDPSGKAQGPFSMVQLRKWSNTGYFPADLKIWRTGGNEDASVLLTDALAGRFTKEFLSMNNGHPKDRNLQTSHIQSTPASNTHGTSDQIRGATPLPKVLTVGLGSDSGGRNDAVNLPSPTPKPSSSFSSANGPLPSPSSATPVNSQKAPLSISPSTNQSGVLQPTRVPENDPASSLQATQLTVTGESQAVQTYGHMLPASDAAAHMVQPINGQNHPYGVHGWGSAPSQHGQALAYGQWGGVPSTAQNPAGNFSTQGVSALPLPPDSWRPPNPAFSATYFTLGHGHLETNTSAPNTSWGTIPGNPNMGWGGPAPANMNVNWGPTLQGPSPGNTNPGWVMPTGNVNPGWVAPNQGPANVNHGWAAPTGPGAVVPGPVPSGNPVANNVQGAGPGNANSGWGSPGASQGMRGNEQHQQHNGDRFSGRRERGGSQGGDSGGGRSWNRQSSFGSGGGSGGSSRHRSGVCRFHESDKSMAACKRAAQLGSNLGIRLSRLHKFDGSEVSPAVQRLRLDSFSTKLFSSLSSDSPFNRVDYRPFSQLAKSNGKRVFLVDTLALVRSLEAQGVPSKQAEAITAAITEVLNDSLENVAHSFVSKAEMQKSEMIQDANLSKFKSEVQSSQEHHFSLLQRETEKLRNDIEKMRSELRYEIDKVTAGQRLDLNLERGRIRDELANQNAETTNLTNKLDREIHGLRAQLEAAKYDVIKYCIGTLVSISAVGLAVLRILM
ncbi:hypothetical protein RJ639_023660, partial [Escallonia herrerae]